MKVRLVSILLTAVILTSASSASAADCYKWTIGLGQCAVVPSSCTNNTPGPMTFGQRSKLALAEHTDFASEACKNFKTYGNSNNPHPVLTKKIDNTTYQCCMDDNEDGVCNDATFTYTYNDYIPKEECCSRIPTGQLHGSITPDGGYYLISGVAGNLVVFRPAAAGEPFTTAPWGGHAPQIQLVRDQNSLGGNLFTSDLWKDQTPPNLSALEYSGCANGVLNNASSAPWQCKPQVDHIVPRKDINGCDCGSNSFKNALLISAKLNNDLSNNCTDPKRISIMNKYAPLPSFAARVRRERAFDLWADEDKGILWRSPGVRSRLAWDYPDMNRRLLAALGVNVSQP